MPDPNPNLAFPLTGPGAAGIAVVRITGPLTRSFLASCFSKPIKPLRCVHGNLVDGHDIIDDPVVVLHEDGQTADLSIHGGPWIIRRCLDLLAKSGFQILDQPGLPLPDEAVDGDTPIEREVQKYLPLARTELALRTLLAQPAAWANLQKHPPTPDQLHRIANSRTLRNLLRLPRVALIGPPNVGKSTLANALFAQQRSITADLPGTTRDWIGEIANIDGLAVMLIDTPGQRPSDDPLETAAIAQSRPAIAAADLVILISDPTTPADLITEMRARHPTALLVLNKADLSMIPPAPSPSYSGERVGVRGIDCFPPPTTISAPPLPQSPASVADENPDSTPDMIPTIATQHSGLTELRSAILRHFDCDSLDPNGPHPFTERQDRLLQQLS